MTKRVYLDNAATTPLNPEVAKTMCKALEELYGNPSSTHALGQAAKVELIMARKTISDELNCKPREIIFTSGGTESDNLAIIGYALKNKHKGNHIISTNIEHNAVLGPLRWLEENGFKVTYVKVEASGIVDPQKIYDQITPETILVSVIYANNEIGTIQPIVEIGAKCREKEIVFHTDACQAVCSLPIDVEALNVDLMTINGSKIYGPKGVGALYKRQGIELEPIIRGGGQEFEMRGGTENVYGIVGLAKALEISYRDLKQKQKHISNLKRLMIEKFEEGARGVTGISGTKLRDLIIEQVLGGLEKVTLNGDRKNRLVNNINFTFDGIEAEVLMARLDMEGICVSAGSACASGSVKPSHVILAIGIPYEKAHGTIRISLGYQNTQKEIEFFIKTLIEIVTDLRKQSPFF